MYSGLLAIALLLGPQSSGYANAKPAPAKHQTGDANGQAVPPVTAPTHSVDEPRTSYTANYYQADAGKEPVPWWDHNWVGFVLAMIALIGNGIGLCFIFRQLVASENAANAALRAAESFVNAERPWLLVEAEIEPHGAILFKATNYGKSPAKIIWRPDMIEAKFITLEESLSPVPYYGYGFDEQHTLVNGIWVAPGKPFFVGVFSSFEMFQDFDLEAGGDLNGRKRLFVYSAIKYRNPFDDKVHETRFCYKKIGNHLKLDGPSGYNDCT